jgi:hypothetical protein
VRLGKLDVAGANKFKGSQNRAEYIQIAFIPLPIKRLRAKLPTQWNDGA